jgi:hypothetical protein
VASIQQDPKSKTFRIRFRFGGRRYFRSLKTTEFKVAQSILGRVEETLRLIEQGRLEIPAKADPGKFILSDGKITSDRPRKLSISLKELLEVYQKRLPYGAKETSTVSMEKTHIKNFLRLLPKARRGQLRKGDRPRGGSLLCSIGVATGSTNAKAALLTNRNVIEAKREP